MKNIEFLGVDINFRTTLDIGKLMSAINIGGITIEKEGRSYMLDALETNFSHIEKGGTIAEIKLDSLENTLDIFTDCKFDMTDDDFMSRRFDVAEMYLTFEDAEDDDWVDYEGDVESITLFYKSGGCTYAVDLEPETFEIVD